jgi:Domain of unknown function (DUF4126)
MEVDTMFASLTGLGLAAAAGLNAYIPLLLVGLVARYSSLLDLPQPYGWLENGWVLTGVTVLLAAEVVLDKIAVVDHVNDAIQTFIRPTVGGVTFSATAAAAQLDQSSWMQENPWVGWVAGIVVAAIVHAGKVGARPVVNVSTAGIGTPVVSAAEDATSLGLSLVALFAPVLVVLGLIALAVVAFLLLRRVRERRRQRRYATPPGYA